MTCVLRSGFGPNFDPDQQRLIEITDIGRIARAELAGSTGDPAVDAAIKNQVLTGLQLQEAPPSGMPLPIVMRITERRPN
jgi:hypothetical protein